MKPLGPLYFSKKQRSLVIRDDDHVVMCRAQMPSAPFKWHDVLALCEK